MADDTGRLNQVLTETSFLYGANAAFVEDLYARWQASPGSVDASWQAFFASLRDRGDEITAAAADPSWTPRRLPDPRTDWLSALDGMWPAVEAKLGKAIEAKAAAELPGTGGIHAHGALLDDDGKLWRHLGNYGGVQAFFGFARREAMGNNGSSHFPSLLNDDGQLWRRLGNNEYYRTERRPNNHKIVRSFSCFRTFVFS